MSGMRKAVQEHDRDRPEAFLATANELAAQLPDVQRQQNAALGVDAFVDFRHAAVEQLGQPDPARENVGTVLVADPERVAKAAGRHQQRGLALALEQRVGRDRRAETHAEYRRAVPDALEQRLHPVQCGIPRVTRVAGQDLVRVQRAVGAPADDVRERTPPVYREAPARRS
jgi:hypothetical protein